MKLKWIFMLLVCSFYTQAQQQIKVHIDLTSIEQDQLAVQYFVTNIQSDTITFHLPKMVPGTYSVYDFGRFISQVEAFDAQGQRIQTMKITDNIYSIFPANQLSKIQYIVDDSFDSKLSNHVFEPAGTNFESENILLNYFGILGYIEGKKDIPYEITITKPENWFGSTSLPLINSQPTTDVFLADNYFTLTDNPVMYCVPDTASVMIGSTEVLVSVFSPSKLLPAKLVMENINEILVSANTYLGGKLPVDKYTFIIYLTKDFDQAQAFGALEHSYSSVYFLPEAPAQYLAGTIKDVAAHEFFHILTPLNIHAEEIGNFDFANPKMSKHLWLYEGATEYFSHHVQIKHGNRTLEEFAAVMLDKIMQSQSQFNDTLPFTVMSKGCLNEHKDQYLNVYQKGALIAMCLDLKLLSLSNGKYGIQQMMKDLANKYGKNKSFQDDLLFDEIAKMTFAEIRSFFSQYVEGPKPLPFEEYFNYVGMQFNPAQSGQSLTLGNIGLGLHEDQKHIVLENVENINDFGKKMGYQLNDMIVSINGAVINVENYQQVLENFRTQTNVGEQVEMVVERKKGKKLKKITLKAPAMAVDVMMAPQLKPNPNPSDDQLALRKAWVNQ